MARDAPELVQQFPALDLTLEEYQELSPIHFASSDDPPALIIHGNQDELVPIVEGESMYQALLQSDVRTEFIMIEGAAHGFVGEDADLALARAVGWFEQHLGRQ